MDAALDTWCTRFAAGAGSQYIWYLNDVGYLRANCGKKERMCPLSAQTTLETGSVHTIDKAIDKAVTTRCQRLTLLQCTEITDAADMNIAQDTALRARLLRICGLTECV